MLTARVTDISLTIADFLSLEDFALLNHAKKVGFFGQQVTKQYLLQNGFEVLAENYVCPGAELDLVVRRHGRVRVVEVKTRLNTTYGEPQEALHRWKLKHLLRGAQQFMYAKGWLGKVPFQIDGCALLVDRQHKRVRLKHFEQIVEES